MSKTTELQKRVDSLEIENHQLYVERDELFRDKEHFRLSRNAYKSRTTFLSRKNAEKAQVIENLRGTVVHLTDEKDGLARSAERHINHITERFHKRGKLMDEYRATAAKAINLSRLLLALWAVTAAACLVLANR
jgi:chromosome segregation ATPase